MVFQHSTHVPLSTQAFDAFGHWLAGFVDGEGCFSLRTDNMVRFATSFSIKLRLDDVHILKEIKRYLRCGHVYVNDISYGNPQAQFVCNNVVDLKAKVVPVFDRCPLRAKKARDYVIWRAAVMIAFQVRTRPNLMRGKGGGSTPKWTEEEKASFCELIDELRRVRTYASPERLATPSVKKRTLFKAKGFGLW